MYSDRSFEASPPSFFPLRRDVSIPATHQHELGQLIRVNELSRILCMTELNQINSELHQIETATPSEERDRKIIEIETRKLGALKNLTECSRTLFSCATMSSPIDISCSSLTFEHRASLSERMQTLTFSRHTLEEGRTVESQINQFVSLVFEQEDSSSFISKDQINTITLQIDQALESDKEVMIVGSLLTLSLVKTIHPVIKSDEETREILMSDSDEHYVPIEGELGGIFFGFEARTAQSEPVTDVDGSTEFSMTNTPQISFICEGASPALGSSFKTLSLWKIYNQWKDAIQTDPQGGRPIRYKCVPLSKVISHSR